MGWGLVILEPSISKLKSHNRIREMQAWIYPHASEYAWSHLLYKADASFYFNTSLSTLPSHRRPKTPETESVASAQGRPPVTCLSCAAYTGSGLYVVASSHRYLHPFPPHRH